MKKPEPTDPTVDCGRALVRAIEPLGIVELSDPFERAVAELFQEAYKRRLMDILDTAPSCVADEILSTSVIGQRGRMSVGRY